MTSRLIIVLLIMFPLLIKAQTKVELFNQKDFSGWYAYDLEAGKQNDASKLFSIHDKTIRLYGAHAGYLMSEKSYTNFKLTAEYRWNTDTTFIRKNDKKNSGLMYLVPNDTPDELWPKGIQYQIKEGATGDFVLLKNVTLEIKGENIGPGASVVSKNFFNAAKPIGEWNTIEIIVNGGKVIQKLNNQLVNEGENPSVTTGRILLQYEGFPIDFRKIELQTY